MSCDVRKPDFCICKNKDADQLRGNREADQRLCFRYTDSSIPLLLKYEISILQPSSVVVQPGLCRTWSEIQKTGFLTTRLIYICLQVASNLCFEISVANGVVVKWETIYDERKLFVEVPNTILPEGSKERYYL